MADSNIDIDGIIAKLLEGVVYLALFFTPDFLYPALLNRIVLPICSVKGTRGGKTVLLTETEIRSLCVTTRELFRERPMLLQLQGPIKICGERNGYAFSVLPNVDPLLPV